MVGVAVGVRVEVLLAVGVEVGAIEGVLVIAGVAVLEEVAAVVEVAVIFGVAVRVTVLVAVGFAIPKNEWPDDPLHPAIRSRPRISEDEAVFRHQCFTLLLHPQEGWIVTRDSSPVIGPRAPPDYIDETMRFRGRPVTTLLRLEASFQLGFWNGGRHPLDEIYQAPGRFGWSRGLRHHGLHRSCAGTDRHPVHAADA